MQIIINGWCDLDNNNSVLELLKNQFQSQGTQSTDLDEIAINHYVSSDDSEYDILQAYEINKGIQDGVDVSIYRTSDYDFLQMQQIRMGLMEKLMFPSMRIRSFQGLSCVKSDWA